MRGRESRPRFLLLPIMLELRGATVSFNDFKALDGVDFSVAPGEIVGLLGENGAGKSTLMNLVGGALQPSSGEIRWNVAPVRFASPRDATRLGIGVVHQHFMLVPVFSIAENLALHANGSGAFHARMWAQRGEDWAASLGWNLDATRRVEDLSVGERQRVEIIKALFARGAASFPGGASSSPENHAARLLLLDEPTSNLTHDEVDELFQVLRRLRDEGRGVVFVSHKLNEVMALCDRVVVLRQGRVAGEHTISQTSASELATLMVGREMTQTTRRFSPYMSTHAAPELPDEAASNAEAPSSDDALENDFRSDVEPRATNNNAVRLSIQGLSCGVLRDFSLQLKNGEIFGLAGVDGNGQAELVEVLSGLRRADSGGFHVLSVDEGAEKNADGAPPKHRAAQRNAASAASAASATASAASSIAVITSDRERIGTIGAFDLAENIALAPALRALCGHRLRFDWAEARSITRELMRRFDVRAPQARAGREERARASSLSGGNQQKLVVARALEWSRGVVVAADPTRGLDVGAARFVREQLALAADAGQAVLLISTDLDEILELSDRIGVLYEGRLLPDENGLPGDVHRETIGALMGGARGGN